MESTIATEDDTRCRFNDGIAYAEADGAIIDAISHYDPRESYGERNRLAEIARDNFQRAEKISKQREMRRLDLGIALHKDHKRLYTHSASFEKFMSLVNSSG